MSELAKNPSVVDQEVHVPMQLSHFLGSNLRDVEC